MKPLTLLPLLQSKRTFLWFKTRNDGIRFTISKYHINEIEIIKSFSIKIFVCVSRILPWLTNLVFDKSVLLWKRGEKKTANGLGCKILSSSNRNKSWKKEKTKFLSVNNRGKSISYSALQFLRVLCKSIISSQSKFSLWWRNKINHITLSNYFRFKPRGVFRTRLNIKDVVTAFYIFGS